MKDVLDSENEINRINPINYILLTTNTFSLISIILLIGESAITGVIPSIHSEDKFRLLIHDFLAYFFPIAGLIFSILKLGYNYLVKIKLKSTLEKYIVSAPFIYLVLFFIFIAAFVE